MATNRREIELLISARDTTGRTFKQVSSSIRDISSDIDAQVAAAQKGEASLESLRKSQQALAQAGRDLSQIQGQIDSFQKLSDTVTRNKDAYETAQANLVKYKAELASVEKVSAAQERRLEGLEKKVTSTGAAFRKSETDMSAAAKSLEQVGIETAQLATQQAGIIASARETGAAFTAIGGAIDNFADNLRLAQVAEAQLAQSTAMDRKIAEAQQLGNASAFVRLYAQAVDQVHLADQRLAALNGFRAVGQLAADASRDVSRFNVEADRMTASASQVAAGLRTIIDPGTEALRTLNGVEAAIKNAGTALNTENQSVAQYSIALNQLSEAGAAIVRQGALVDTFVEQERAVLSARNEFERAQADVQRFAAAMAAAEAPTEGLVRDLAQAEAGLETAGRSLKNQETRLLELSRALEAAGIDSRNLAAEQDRLAAAATRAAASMSQGNQILGRGGEKSNGLFGLNPHEMQNLSFQLQDIFVSLASGQAPLTVLVQQGTQIGALFPGLITKIGAFALAWAPAIIAVTAITVALAKVIIQMNDLARAQALLNLRGITDIDVSAVDKVTDRFEKLKLSSEDARNAVSDLLDIASNQQQFLEMAKVVENLNKKLGIDMTEALKLVQDQMTGGIEQTEALATETSLLSERELEHADALFEAGRAADARQYILDRVNAKLKEQASLTSGVFTPAINNLKLAWNNFTSFLQRVFKPVIDAIDLNIKRVIHSFTILTGLLAGKGFAASVADANKAIGVNQPAAAPNRDAAASSQQIRDRAYERQLDEEIENTRELTKEERLRNAEIKARRDAQAAGVSDLVEERAATQAILAERKKINEEEARDAKKSGNAARAAQRRAEAAARRLASQRNSTINQLTSSLNQLNADIAKGTGADLANRLQVIDDKYAKIATTVTKLRGLGVGAVNGKTLEDIEAQAKAQQDRIKQEETLKFLNEEIAAMDAQRAAQAEFISANQERGAISLETAYESAKALNDEMSPKIVATANKALEIAEAIAKIAPSREIQAMIAQLRTLTVTEPTNPVAQNIAQTGFDQSEKKLNDLLAQRNDLVQSYNTLREIGIMTDEEARDATARAYQSTKGAISEAVLALVQQVELLHNTKDALTGLPLITDTAYAAWQAKIEAINAGLDATNHRLKTVEDAARQGLAQGIVTAFNAVGDSIAGLILGTMSFGDAIGNVFRGALSLVQQFVQAVADAILQMAALEFAKKLIKGGTFGFLGLHSGGTVGGAQGSRMVRTGMNDNWVGAPKFHTGGGMGLRDDEYKAVLKVGEEVLTEDDPRHIRNLGKGGGGDSAPAGSIKQVLLFDQAEIPRAMQTRSGEKAILSVLKSNAATVKQMLK